MIGRQTTINEISDYSINCSYFEKLESFKDSTGITCPYCGSKHITSNGKSFDKHNTFVTEIVNCNTCSNIYVNWFEVKLERVSVEDHAGNIVNLK
jgi:DNA-directed RNA polymerase subunit RPC12/RpoP